MHISQKNGLHKRCSPVFSNIPLCNQVRTLRPDALTAGEEAPAQLRKLNIQVHHLDVISRMMRIALAQNNGSRGKLLTVLPAFPDRMLTKANSLLGSCGVLASRSSQAMGITTLQFTKPSFRNQAHRHFKNWSSQAGGNRPKDVSIEHTRVPGRLKESWHGFTSTTTKVLIQYP